MKNRLRIPQGALKLMKNNHLAIFNSFTHDPFQSLTCRRNETPTGSVNYNGDERISGLYNRLVGIFSQNRVGGNDRK